MRKNTLLVDASSASAVRAARAGVAAASVVVVTAAGLAFAAPASADTDHDTIPVVTSPATSSTIFDRYPTFAGTSKSNYSGTLYLTSALGAKFTYCTFKSDANGNWSCSNPKLPLDYTAYMVDVTVYHKGATSNFAIADPAKAPYAVTTPGFGATADTSRPVFTGTGLPGLGVFVFNGDTGVAVSTMIKPDGTWSAESFADFADGPHVIRVDFMRGTTVVSSLKHFIYVNTVAPAASVAFSGPVDGETVADSNPVFTGSGEPGAAVVVSDANGVELASTTVGTDGAWAVTSEVALANGAVTATATQTVAGATGATTASVSFTVAAAAHVAQPLTLTSPAIGDVVAVSKPEFSGTGEPGATIRVKGSSGRVLASATVDAAGNWSVTSEIELGNDHYVGTVSQVVPGGDTTSVALSYTVKVVAAKGFEVTSPAIGAVLATDTPVFAGVGTPGATVEIRGSSGRVLASTTIDADGNWSATSQVQLSSGRYVGYATQAHSTGSSAANLDYTIAQALTVTSPGAGESIAGPRPVYSGTAHPGATIEIKGSSGRTIASAVVDSYGVWSATADFDLGAGRYTGTAVQSYDGTKLGTVAMDYLIK
ncbi:hypothetical protein GCM10027406_01770 [Leifsonia lichenia]